MKVLKRNGQFEQVSFDKVTNRISCLCNIAPKLNIIDPIEIAQKVCALIYDGVPTSQLDELAAEICIQKLVDHIEYGILASRIIISNNQKLTSPSFSETISILYNNTDKRGNPAPLISQKVYEFVMNNKQKLNTYIDYTRDYMIDYFGYKTLEKSYLMRINGKVVERIGHMFMRVACGIHTDNLRQCLETYDMMSQKFFTHATPTLFHSGTPNPQLLSCFLLGIEDSVSGIYKAVSDCAMISKWAGGIGVHIHDIRAENSVIRKTNGHSNGLVPMLKVFNDVARHINQCFTPDTYVYGSNGPIQMVKCKVGEKLYTIDGTLKPILGISVNKVDKTILSVSNRYSLFPTKVTHEHQIYAISNIDKNEGIEEILDKLQNNIIKPAYISAGELKLDDYIGYSIPNYIVDSPQHTLDDMYLYGLLLAHGEFNPYKNRWILNLDITRDQPKIEFVHKYLGNKHINHWTDTSNNNYEIQWSPNNSILINYYDLYDIYSQKVIHRRFLNLPHDKLASLLRGLIDIDSKQGDVIIFTNSSLRLILQIRLQLLKLKIPTSGNIKPENKSYTLAIPLDEYLMNVLGIQKDISRDYFIWDNIIWSRINHIDEIHYSGDVYDFNMMDNHNYLTDMGIVHNSGKRNGSFAMYLEPHHPDILGFLEAKKNHGDENARARDLFYALWISDLFMERVKNKEMWSLFCPDKCPNLSNVYGDEYKKLYEEYERDRDNIVKQVPALDIWKEILNAQMETGTPYICYKDAANKKSNQQHYGTIKSSNLCVAPETLILTNEGHKEIQTLRDQWVDVWNGKEWSNVQVKQTGENQELITVKLSDGSQLDCTKYHKFYIQNNNVDLIEAKDLKPGMKLIKCEYPTIDNDNILLSAYEIGYFSQNRYLNENDQYFVPIDYSLTSKLEWFAGLCDALGYQYEFNGRKALYIVNSNRSYLQNIKYMLQTCGINPDIITNSDEDKTINVLCRIRIYIEDIYLLIKQGLKFRLQNISQENITEVPYISITIDEIVDNGRIDDTYCFTEPKRNAGIFNGIITSQCTEIIEYSDDKEYACCTLASISLPAFIEDFDFSSIKDIKIYSKSNCKFCTYSKKYLESYGLKYTEINLDNDDERGEFFSELNRNAIECDGDSCKVVGKRFTTVPQIFINDVHIGGFTELYKYIKPKFNFGKLIDATKVVTNNLNKVIDINYYPVPETELSNKRHRPIGIGVQGLADVYARFRYAFDSDEATQLNKEIFATIYYGSMVMSNKLAIDREQLIADVKEQIQVNSSPENVDKLLNQHYIFNEELGLERYTGAYSTFDGSPLSKGMFQFDLWDSQPLTQVGDIELEWDELRKSIMLHGVRNSLLVAPMPTASTSQILGNNEAIEPFTSNIYSRGTLAGQFLVLNKYLQDDLIRLNIWNRDLKDTIIVNNGSIKLLDSIPQVIKDTYKISWDLSMKSLINQAADRGIYVCQSQSLNLWVENPDINKMSSMHFYSWSKGLKTGIYYLRRRAVSKAQAFTIDPNKERECLSCSS